MNEIKYEKMTQCDIWIRKEGWKVARMILCAPEKILAFSLANILYSSDLVRLVLSYCSLQICFYVEGQAFWKDEMDETLSPLGTQTYVDTYQWNKIAHTQRSLREQYMFIAKQYVLLREEYTATPRS